MPIKILHFSDFHLDNNHQDWASSLLNLMIESINIEHVHPDLILFTGDMLNKGKGSFGNIEEGFMAFKNKVMTVLCKELGLDSSRFIFVPGNHDIDRSVIDDIEEDGIENRTQSEQDVNNFIHHPQIEKYTQRIQAYKDFEKKTYEALNVNYHYGRFASTFKIQLGEITIGILGLNSVWRCGIADEKKIVLGKSQITENIQTIRDCDIKIAMCHHHYTKLKEFERENLKTDLANDVDMYLTGHEHKYHSEYVYINNGNGFFDVTTAGALTTNIYVENQKFKNAFQIITYYPESKKIETSVYQQCRGELFTKDLNYGDGGVFACYALTQKEIETQLDKKVKLDQKSVEIAFMREIFPFTYIRDYLSSKERFREKFVESKKISNIINQLQGEGKRLRFMALSGMGKTRIVLEAFKKQENVFYSPVCECKEGLLRLLTHRKEGVIIIDNCPIEKQRDIEKILSETVNNFKLVTIHNVLTNSEMRVDAGLLDFTYKDSAEIIEKILSDSPVLVGKDDLKDRIRLRSGNIPFMALLLLQAYERNRNLKIENRNAVLSSLLRSCEEDSNKWRVLNCVSMFDPLGKDDGLQDEFTFVITNPDIHRIEKEQEQVNLIFKNTLQEFEERQLVEHDGSCIRVRPLPLAEWLAEDWLQRNGADLEAILLKISATEQSLSIRLMSRIDKRFKGLKDSPYAQELVKDFNIPEKGVFSKDGLAFSNAGSQLFLSMGQVNPTAVAQNMYSLLRKKTSHWLKNAMDARVRRNWVWALTNIAADSAAFPNAARSLLLLALAESEGYTNNATGQFMQLFHIMLSGTMAPLEPRADIIEEMYSNGIERELIMQTIRHAYTVHSVILDMNDCVRDEEGNLCEYTPETYGHILRYWMRCKGVLELIATEKAEYRVHIRYWLPNCLRDMCEYGGWVVYEQLLNTFYIEGDDWIEMYKGISFYLKHGNMTGDLRTKLEEWKQKLTPKNFLNRLNKVILEAFADRKISYEERQEYEKELMLPLVDEFVNGKLYEDGYTLPTMIRDETFRNYLFVREMVKLIEEGGVYESVVGHIIETIRGEMHEFESIFVRMFALEIRNKNRLNQFRDELFKLKYYRMAATIEGLLDDDKHNRLMKVIEAFERGEYDACCVDNYLRGLRYRELPYSLEIYNVLHNHPSEELNDLANRFMSYSCIHMSTDEIMASGKLKEFEQVLLSYPYKGPNNQLAHEYVRKINQILLDIEDAEFAFAVHRKAVETLSIDYVSDNPFEHIYFTLLPKYQDAILLDLIEVLADEKNLYYNLSMTNHLGSGFSTGNGPLFQCDNEVLKTACKKHPKCLPRLFANMCPIYEWVGEKRVSLSKFFLWLCDEFGDNVEVLYAFDANLNTFSWTGLGGMSSYYAAEIPYFEPLLNHPKLTVREWAKAEIQSIQKDVEREINSEGYERMTMG